MINKRQIDTSRYTPQLLLSHKRELMMVVGERRVGKTFSITYTMIRKALTQKQITFLWLRINKTEIDDAKKEFFKDMEKFNIFPDYIFSIKGKYGYAKNIHTGETFPICYFDFIKNAQNLKSIPFPYVRYVVLDEFMEERGKNLCKNKVSLLYSILYSVFSLRPIRCIMIGNAVTMEDPFFKQLHITNIERPFTRGKNYVVENTNKELRYDKFRSDAKVSSFGQIVSGTSYGDYALDNKFMLDDMTNIEVKPLLRNDMLIGVVLENITIGIFNEEKYIYIKKVKSTRDDVFITPITNKATPLIDFHKYSDEIFKRLMNYIVRKEVYYQSLEVKNAFVELRDKTLGNFQINE